MKRKLRRSRRSVFGRKEMPRGLKTFLWLVVCVAVVALGYFGAMLLAGDGLPRTQPEVSVSGNDSAPTPDTPSVDPDADGEEVVPNGGGTPQTPAALSTVRGFYLPASALGSDTLSTTLSQAYAAGFNAVVFDLKDADGTLYYQFTSAQAKKVNSYAADALTADELTAAFDLIREHGLQPIPRLYAFCDDPAAKVLTDARIAHADNHTWAWYDADPNNGGKKWLNPYSPAARDYVGALAEELKAQGAAAVMLDGVQFPSQLSSAYLGEEAATVSKSDALTAFVAAMRTRLGDDCPVILSCTEKGALATDTKVYGGNPLTFGPAMVSPQLTAKVQESVEAMLLRMQVLDDKPDLVPMLKTIGLTAKQVNDTISACVSGGAESFILFDHEGYYEFSAYGLP